MSMLKEYCLPPNAPDLPVPRVLGYNRETNLLECNIQTRMPGVGVEDVKAVLDAGKPVQFIDARPWPAVARKPEIMQGAKWRDPERVQEWAGELSKSEPVVVCCAYGFHVGCKTAIALRDLGFDAKFMTGGHSAWKAINGPTKPCV